MTPEEAVQKLDAIKGGDPEASHSVADAVLVGLLEELHPEVIAAYERVVGRESGRWWFA